MATAGITRTPRTVTDAGLLRLALKADAIASGANGVLYVAAAAVFGELFGLPAAFLYPAGAFLVAFAAVLFLIASRPAVSRVAVGVTMAVNVAWVAASVESLVAGWFPLTGLGTALVIAQAVAVAGLTALQFAGLRKAS
ncbi:hypothetical protein ACIBCT_01510 [Streptosporangium sp. NPDC050855]|uniref:hypothetical protein n=1 Tax=Streptosporangium sp. NPDC050855 TaxID=3366194 RepID=UPI00378E0142